MRRETIGFRPGRNVGPALIAVGIASTWGCTNDPAAPHVSAGDLPLSDVFVAQNASNVLSYSVEWSTSRPATTELRVVCEGVRYDEAFSSGDFTREHELLVIGLVAESECILTLRSMDADGLDGVGSITVNVAPLPDFLPSGFEVAAPKRSDAQPGWTLANFHNHSQGGELSVGLIDLEGRFRWYSRIDTNRFGTLVHEVSMHPEGVLVGSVGDLDPALVGWDNETIYTAHLPDGHHDLRRYPDAHHLTYPTRGMPCGGQRSGGGVARIDMRTGELVWRWDLCTRYAPTTFFEDWAHINTYEPNDDGTFLLSMRNQNAIIKVDEATGDVLWHLGPGGDFELGPGAEFAIQHAVEALPNGNILLFDNGSMSRGYSRALELTLDEGAMRAVVAWEWVPSGPEPSWWTEIWGDADRLPNGNTLINFAQANPEYRAHVVEVDAAGETVWDLAYSKLWASYRADRVTPPARIRARSALPSRLYP